MRMQYKDAAQQIRDAAEKLGLPEPQERKIGSFPRLVIPVGPQTENPKDIDRQLQGTVNRQIEIELGHPSGTWTRTDPSTIAQAKISSGYCLGRRVTRTLPVTAEKRFKDASIVRALEAVRDAILKDIEARTEKHAADEGIARTREAARETLSAHVSGIEWDAFGRGTLALRGWTVRLRIDSAGNVQVEMPGHPVGRAVRVLEALRNAQTI